MGADIFFKTRKNVNIENCPMFERYGNDVIYFRDPYNPFNLAWIADLSYWELADEIENGDYAPDEILKKWIEFFQKIASLTDKDIEHYVQQHKDDYKLSKQDIEFFKRRRNCLKKILDAEIIDIEQSV